MPDHARAAAAVLCSISGLAVILLMGVSPASDGIVLIVLAMFGAAIGGAIVAPLFGAPGWGGAGFATLGAVLATALGAAIAGFAFGLAAGEPIAGLFFGPMTVFTALVSSPVILAGWLLTMTCAHFGLAQFRFGHGRPS